MIAQEVYLSIGQAKRLIQLKPVLDASPKIAAVASTYQAAVTKRSMGCRRCPNEKKPPPFNLTNRLCEAIRDSDDNAKKVVAGFLHARRIVGHVTNSAVPVVLIDLNQ